MKNYLYIVAVLLFVSCASVKEIPIQTNKIDSIKVEKVVEYRDTIIYVEVPKEVVREVVPELDTLVMENSVSISRSYLDASTKTLKGVLRTKKVKIDKEVKLPETTEKEETYVEIIKEIPVRVEVEKKYIPKWAWYSLMANIVVGMLIGFRLFLKFKP